MANDIIDQTGNKLPTSPTELLIKLKEEVQSEFTTSKDKVYKEALRSLILQEDKLKKQANDIAKDMDKIQKVKAALDKAYTDGQLISREDAKAVTAKALKTRSKYDGLDDDEEGPFQ